jgi:hypothetical protein
MIILDATTKKLQAKLAASGTAVKLFGVYADTTSAGVFTPGSTDLDSNGTTDVDIVPAPASGSVRQVKNLYIYNGDTVSHTVTVEFNDNGTERVFAVQTIAPGESVDLMSVEGPTGAQLGVANEWTAAQTFTGGIAGVMFGLRNKIINGCFRKWDYATTYAGASYGGPNRWAYTADGSTHASSRQSFTAGQTEVPGEPEYFHRTVVTSSAGASNRVRVTQAIEGVRSFAGKTVTLSFYAKADASKNISIELFQDFGSGGSPSSAVVGIGVNKVALTTSWQKITLTISVHSITGKTVGTNRNDNLALSFWFDAGADYNARTDSLGQQSGTFDIAQVQLEEGSVATPFEQRPIGIEETLCARYLPVLSSVVVDAPIGAGACYSTTQALCFAPFCSTARTRPTGISISSATDFQLRTSSAARATCSGVSFYEGTQYSSTLNITVAAVLVAGDATPFESAAVTAKIIFTGCEL